MIKKEIYLNALEALKITPNQLYFLILTSDQDYKSLYQYVRNIRPFSQDEIEDLKEKGLVRILKGADESSDFADNFRVTKKFLKVYDSDGSKFKRAQEFWDAFPKFIYIDGKKFPARNTDKDAFLYHYGDVIGNSIEKHKEVMQGLERAKKANQISMGLYKWFKSEQWEAYSDQEENKKKIYGGHEFTGK